MPSCWCPIPLLNSGSFCTLPTSARLSRPRTLRMPCSSLHRNGATITKEHSPTDRHDYCKTICLLPSNVLRCSPTSPTRRRVSTCSSNGCKRNHVNKLHKQTIAMPLQRKTDYTNLPTSPMLRSIVSAPMIV